MNAVFVYLCVSIMCVVVAPLFWYRRCLLWWRRRANRCLLLEAILRHCPENRKYSGRTPVMRHAVLMMMMMMLRTTISCTYLELIKECQRVELRNWACRYCSLLNRPTIESHLSITIGAFVVLYSGKVSVEFAIAYDLSDRYIIHMPSRVVVYYINSKYICLTILRILIESISLLHIHHRVPHMSRTRASAMK